MTLNQLSSTLKEMYSNAPKKEQVTMVHLFGIKYAEHLQKIGVREVVQQSGLPISYNTEINKGINLAKYVSPKQ
ncbi:MAG: hypothetical protein JNK20_10040 [Flavipsychrobacter sp.]|nr:hypothetical protein [Flavipsychrobacter sp.]